MFTKAIVRIPGRSLISGLTSANLGVPDYELAMKQHSSYIRALRSCGVEVTILEADENFPDSTFVEDVALLTSHCAIITRPGAISRRDEISLIDSVLQEHFSNIERIEAPGTLEAGDVMMVGSHFYIGLSERTNVYGASQLMEILQKYGMTGSMVELEKMLHLKTGVSYLEQNNLLATGEFVDHEAFEKYNILEVDQDEDYAANCIWVNGKVLVPAGFPKTRSKIEMAGCETITVDVSEFRKLDGGLSCLSLRF